MKRKIAALLMGTTLSVAVCGYSVQAMTYGYDMGGKVFISEDSSSSNLTEEEKEKLSDWHKEEMRNELAYLECYGVTYDADSDTLYYQGKTVRWLIDRQLEDTYKSIQMPEGEIDVYTVREDDYRLTGVRIATQEEYDQRTKEMEALEAAAGKESSYEQEAVDTETGSSIHMFAYDEETVTEANDGSATETAVVTEDVVSNYAEQKDTVENAVETAEGTCVVGDNLNSEIKIQEYKQNGIDLDSATGSWMWHGKEVHLLMDEEEKGNHIRVLLKPGTDTETVYCQIENTGVFIPEEALVHLFEAFYRVEQSRNRQTGGSGLGLYIVKMILDQHGASYRMGNTCDGVCFSFSL